jgi:hypothetical protein
MVKASGPSDSVRFNTKLISVGLNRDMGISRGRECHENAEGSDGGTAEAVE